MDKLFLIFSLCFFLVGCGKDKEDKLDSRLFKGTGKWGLATNQSSPLALERTFTFVKDEQSYKMTGFENKTFKIAPVTETRMRGINIKDKQEVILWNYSFYEDELFINEEGSNVWFRYKKMDDQTGPYSSEVISKEG